MSLAEKIERLEAEIEGYREEYASATSDTRKDGLLAAITARTTILHDLMQQQQPGKYFECSLLVFVVDGILVGTIGPRFLPMCFVSFRL